MPVNCLSPYHSGYGSTRALGRIARMAFVLVSALHMPLLAQAQTDSAINYAGTQTQINATGLSQPYKAVVDSGGNTYIVDNALSYLIEVDASGNQSSITPTTPLLSPYGIAIDSSGNLYVADSGNARVLEIAAGTGLNSNVGSGWTYPQAVAVDSAGDVYVADGGNAYEVPVGGSTIETIPLPSAYYVDVSVDPVTGSVYLMDLGNAAVDQLQNGAPTQLFNLVGFYGSYQQFTVDNGIAYVSFQYNAPGKIHMFQLNGNYMGWIGTGLIAPYGLSADATGNIYVADNSNDAVYQINPNAVDMGSFNVCPAWAINPSNCSSSPVTLNFNIEELSQDFATAETHVVTQGVENLDFTTTANTCTGDQSELNSCSVTVLFTPTAPGVRKGAVEIASTAQSNFFRGGSSHADAVQPGSRSKAAVHPNLTFGNGAYLIGTLFLEGTGIGAAPYFDAGEITTLPLGLPADAYPTGLAIDSSEKLYVPDAVNPSECYIYQENLNAPATATVLAGVGSCGYDGDGGPANLAKINPWRVAVNGRGDVYFVDYTNQVVRMIDANTGNISTIAGGNGATTHLVANYGDGGPAANAEFVLLTDIAIDGQNNIYLVDDQAHTVRRIDAFSGIITTVAGSYASGASNPGFSGDGGPAASAQLRSPTSVAIDTAGNLYIADVGNIVIRKVAAGTGIITTFAGNHTLGMGYSGDGGPATSAQISDDIEGIGVDMGGNVYITDTDNFAVRRVDAATGIISLVTGTNHTTETYTGDGGPANQATISYAEDVVVDQQGRVIIADSDNHVVRVITPNQAIQSFPQTTASTSSPAQDLTLTNIGTGDLVLSALGTSTNFDSLGPDTTCTSSTTLTPGGSCILGERFSPTTGGALSGTTTVTDYDAINAPGSNVVSLSGTAVPEVDAQVALGAVPTTLAAGGNPGTIDVSVEYANGTVDTTATNAVTLTITGPNDFNRSYTVSAAAGVAVFNLSSLALPTAGTYTVTATSGDLATSVKTIAVTAAQAQDAQVALGNVPTTLVAGGNPGTINASIEYANGAVDPGATSSVTLTITGPNSFTQTYRVNAVAGTATFNLSSLTLPTAGTYTVTATSGDLATSVKTIAVTAAQPQDAQVALGSVPTTLVAGGNPGTITASIENANGMVDPTATSPVILTIAGPNGFNQSDTVNAVAGVAAFNLSSLALPTAGTYTVTATSGGLTTSVKTINVTAPQLQISLGSVPPTLSSGGNPGQVRITIQNADGSLNTGATGTVTLTITGPGFSQAVSGTLVGGIFTFNLTGIALTTPGTYTVTAAYANLSRAVATIVVSAPTVTDFTIAANSPTSAGPIEPGASAAYQFTLAPQSGSFTSAITLTATGLPAGATYSFSPSTVTPGASSANTKLTVNTSKSQVALSDAKPWRAFGSLALGMLLLPLAGGRRMRKAAGSLPLAAIVLALLSLGAVMGISGCGSAGLFGRPQQTYTVTVTGNSGALTHSTTVTLTVQ